MNILLFASVVLLFGALWKRWLEKEAEADEQEKLIDEVRARAKARQDSRSYKDTEPSDWETSLAMQTAIDVTVVPVDIKKLTAEQEITVSLLLNDIEAMPEVTTTDGLDVVEIDMDKDVWNKL